jgi:CheY-like chemotaxis protein
VTIASKRKARILVVDDDPGLLRLLTIRLRAESYDVEAVDGARKPSQPPAVSALIWSSRTCAWSRWTASCC